jgi:hypothetical protein
MGGGFPHHTGGPAVQKAERVVGVYASTTHALTCSSVLLGPSFERVQAVLGAPSEVEVASAALGSRWAA